MDRLATIGTSHHHRNRLHHPPFLQVHAPNKQIHRQGTRRCCQEILGTSLRWKPQEGICCDTMKHFGIWLHVSLHRGGSTWLEDGSQDWEGSTTIHWNTWWVWEYVEGHYVRSVWWNYLYRECIANIFCVHGEQDVEAALKYLVNLGTECNDLELDVPDYVTEFYPEASDL